MLSKTKIKLIQSLNRKKDRDETGLFLVEGNKMVDEALASNYNIISLVCTPEFLKEHPQANERANEIIETDNDSIQRASLLQNPQEAIAIVQKTIEPEFRINPEAKLYLALDFIQDPGNLGTIIRIADWFGIDTIICSENTVDVFNPKVVQATMGAIFRVNCHYTNLVSFLEKQSAERVPVYGTFMTGANLYTEKLTSNGIIVMGNEGNGISDSVGQLVSKKISIPTFSTQENKSESLNVAIATAICCSEFKRKRFA